jgi:hypothetical protein
MDIFFSYKSEDRERVRPFRDALAEQGFEVFWDQEVPVGADWDTWIREHLNRARCAVVFWSVVSVRSDNVRHEATVAKQQGKLIPVLLEPLRADQFPMGLYMQQAAVLSGWEGNRGHEGWSKLQKEIEAKLTPAWVQRQIHELEAELVAERARRAALEGRDKANQAQIVKEAQARQELQIERDKAHDEAEALKAKLADFAKGHKTAEDRAVELANRRAEEKARMYRLEIAQLTKQLSAKSRIAVTSPQSRIGSPRRWLLGASLLFATGIVFIAVGYMSGDGREKITVSSPGPAQATGNMADEKPGTRRATRISAKSVRRQNLKRIAESIQPPPHPAE